ncbi:HipA domain-containing protein [Symbiopectobacterium purcellii]|uniref:HipA domain-containing protein n=1 Tax=Symbiopectobacterium purcellii TaxID=2871826 RepID=UPI003F83EC44
MQQSLSPLEDLAELWRRIVFNLLITNVDDHLQNHGFLHVEHGQWRLAPAFDVNPFPDKDQELKLWLDEDYGTVDSIDAVLAKATDFRLSPQQANAILAQVYHTVDNWRASAILNTVGMTKTDIDAFIPAFENPQMQRAAQLIR